MGMEPSPPTHEQVAKLLAPLNLHDHEDIVGRVCGLLDGPAHPATVLLCAYMLESDPVKGQVGELAWQVGPHMKRLPWLQVEIEHAGQRVVFPTRFPLAAESLERDFFQQVWLGTNPAIHLKALNQEQRADVWRYIGEDAQESARCQEDAARIQAIDTVGLLHHAVMVGDRQGMEDALLLGAPIQGTDDRGNGVLHVAARMGRHEHIQPLVGAGALVNEPNHAGQTPLHLAAGRHCPMTCTTLLALGANASLVDAQGRTALDATHAPIKKEREHVQDL